eukprot:767008-Hanusia_phi.AAC.2
MGQKKSGVEERKGEEMRGGEQEGEQEGAHVKEEEIPPGVRIQVTTSSSVCVHEEAGLLAFASAFSLLFSCTPPPIRVAPSPRLLASALSSAAGSVSSRLSLSGRNSAKPEGTEVSE